MTRATKSIKVEVYTFKGESAFVFDDSVNAGAGTSALAQLSAKAMIHALANSVDTYIPFHAIDHAVLTITNSSEEVSDAVCAE